MARRGGRRTGLAWFAGLVAASAYGGALGLLVGFVNLGSKVTARLPFGSPVLGGLALALVVAVPSTVLTWLAWHGDPRTDAAAVASGVLIIGWIVVQLAFIREFSFFHPTYVVVGAAMVWVGRRALRRPGSATV
jgi:hypothetical protein